MMMPGKKFIISCLCFLIVVKACAQQQPYYTQYILNNFILNPALAGIENYWDVKASHRHQWVGLDGAPVTTYITIRGMELLMVNPFPWELITISLMQKTMKKKWQVLLPYLSNA